MTNPPKTQLVIEPRASVMNVFAELASHRELVWALARRDVVVRYKQTLLGVAWAVLRPAMTMALFTMVFAHVARLPSPRGESYALLVMTGLLPWQLFAATLTASSESLFANAALLTKVYFPRLLLPLSAAAVAIVDYAIVLVLTLIAVVASGHVDAARWLLLVPLTVLTLGLALGIGLACSTLSVRFRDVRQLIPFLLQLGLYASPVGYSSGLVGDAWQAFYRVNPMVGVIDGFRWVLLSGQDFPAESLAVSLLFSILLFPTSLAFFIYQEPKLADAI